VGRRARPSSLEHVIADPLGTRHVLVTGAGGQLGTALLEAFPGALGLAREQWDVAFPPPPLGPVDLMLHAAAWTDVDGAEADPQGAAAVNVGGTLHAAELGAPIVYFSTDYVFDGRKREPYVESDGPNPLSAYGRTKLHGEAAAGEQAWIVRSAWIFGWTGRNFLRTMLALGRERDEVAVVDDQWHVAADGDCTWAEFAEAIFEEAGVDCRVRRITTEELGRPAPRPAYSVLRSERPEAPRLPHWRDGLRECLARL
jgi:dTDP-4-dehydrorhamnose reductase